MPFTLSHAVVALPFVRTPLVPAAIAVGAMTPDFPLFVRTGLPLYSLTHSLPAVPLTMLVALVLLLVWRCIVRAASEELAPRWIAERLPAAWRRGAGPSLRETFARAGDPAGPITWASVGLLVTSLAIGVVSHIAWDLFTHEGRWGVEAIPALGEAWGPVPGYTWIQHGSSALGLAILTLWAVRWLSRRRLVPVRRMLSKALRGAWWISLPLVLAAAWGWGLVTYGPLTSEWTPQHLAYRVLPAAAGAWAVASVVVAALIAIMRRRTAERRGTGG